MKTLLPLLMSISILVIVISCGSSGGIDVPDDTTDIEDVIKSDIPDSTDPIKQGPVAVMEADQLTGEAPLEVLFTGSSSYDPEGSELSYSWDFGDGDTSLWPDPPVHTYVDPGTYTVTLTVTNEKAESSSISETVESMEPADTGVFINEEEGIVAGLSLDENIDENSTAEIFGETQWVDGVDGLAMEFDAEGEYILLPDTDNLDFTVDVSIEVWIFPYTNIDAAGIVHKGVEEDYSDESYSLQYNQAGQVAIIITNDVGTATYVISDEGLLSTYEWHHIVVAWDLNEVYLYIDGDLVTNRRIYSNGWKSELPADFAPARNSDGGLMIGSQIPLSCRFDGIIDNVLLYDRVIDALEVAEHYTLLAP